MKFLDWNNKLAAHFFRPERAGRQVFLFVTEELLDELGRETNDSSRDFIAAVKAGHAWRPPGHLNICQKAIHCFENWRLRGFDYPPYIGYLGLFVLAAGREGDYAPNAYYARLWDLLRENGHGMVPDFNQMWQLWEDLERWANESRAGELGVFTCRRTGQHEHVGLPLAQTIITEEERGALPNIFAMARFDPTSSPSASELQLALRTFGTQVFRPSTTRLLSHPSNEREDLLNALLSRVRDELEQWDGQVEIEEAGRPSERHIFGSLRLCASINQVLKTASFSLRCCLNREFPEATLTLQGNSPQERFNCEGELLHWSTPLASVGTSARLDAARFDWNAGLELFEERLNWRFRLPASPIRILLKGESEGMRGYMEVHQLRPCQPFILAVKGDCSSQMEAWGKSSCKQFENMTVRKGLPAGWLLYRSDGSFSDELVRNDFPSLAFPLTIRLLFRGGIRSTRRNTYFRFAPPSLVLEGKTGKEIVHVDGHELKQIDGMLQLPPSLPAGIQVLCDVRIGDETIARQSLSLIESFDWQWTTPDKLFDGFGSPVDVSLPEQVGCAGASLIGLPPVQPMFIPPPSCFERKRVFFIGRIPGQIIAWPSEDLPDDWSPVWAVPMTRRGKAIFCGLDSVASEPINSQWQGGKSKMREWKDVLYQRRKQIDPPHGPGFLKLWHRFQEVARLVRI